MHCGVELISILKRIMHAVMTLAEDVGLDSWYQDTDAMDINYEEIERLANYFKNKYNKCVIGDEMPQFHIDVVLDGVCGETDAT